MPGCIINVSKHIRRELCDIPLKQKKKTTRKWKFDVWRCFSSHQRRSKSVSNKSDYLQAFCSRGEPLVTLCQRLNLLKNRFVLFSNKRKKTRRFYHCKNLRNRRNANKNLDVYRFEKATDPVESYFLWLNEKKTAALKHFFRCSRWTYAFVEHTFSYWSVERKCCPIQRKKSKRSIEFSMKNNRSKSV